MIGRLAVRGNEELGAPLLRWLLEIKPMCSQGMLQLLAFGEIIKSGSQCYQRHFPFSL
jgi:hypothetical protein